MTITCDTVRRAFGENHCCYSCHDEMEQGYGNLCGDGENFEVCCKVAQWLEGKGVDVYNPPTHPELLRVLKERQAEYDRDV